jgi:tetratricopeptide (TPR) repeat protein
MMLSREIGDPQQVFPLMYGRWSYQQVTGHVTQSLQLAREIVTLAKQYERSELLVIACRLLGTSLQVTGDPVAGVRELEQAVTLFDPEVHTPLAHFYGSDVNVTALCSLALAQWTLGLNRSANRNIESAWKRSAALGHDNTLAYCGGYRLAIRAIGERIAGFREILDDFSRLMTERRLPVWLSVCKGYLGWLQLRSGEVDAAVRSLHECIGAMTAINLVYWQATIWMWLGDAVGLLGDLEGAEEAFSRSLEIMTRSGERWAEPELYRLWACGRRRAGAPGAEELFQRSLNVARGQRASAWLVRTYLDLTYDPNTAEAEKARNGLHDILLQIPESERGDDFAAA